MVSSLLLVSGSTSHNLLMLAASARSACRTRRQEATKGRGEYECCVVARCCHGYQRSRLSTFHPVSCCQAIRAHSAVQASPPKALLDHDCTSRQQQRNVLDCIRVQSTSYTNSGDMFTALEACGYQAIPPYHRILRSSPSMALATLGHLLVPYLLLKKIYISVPISSPFHHAVPTT